MFHFLFLCAFLGLPFLANAFHNVTYNDNDPALVYSPSGAWEDWPPAGCLSWPGGQWTTNSAGQITLTFEGVAVYVYGIFDDQESNPIYTVTIDNETPVRLGNTPVPLARKCDPLYSKTGLAMKNHTVVFKMTNERPDDVKDLSFQGFIVTVPDEGDDVSTGNPKKSSKMRYIIIAAVAVGVVIVIIVVVALLCHRKRRRQEAATPVSEPAFANNQTFVNPYHPMPSTPGVAGPGGPPPPVPFILPSRESTPQQNQAPAPWLAQNQPPTPWNPQLQHQPQPQYQQPQPQHQYQPHYQPTTPWSVVSNDTQPYPSPAPTPFSAHSHGTHPSNTASSPPPPTENYTQYSYPPPSIPPSHTPSNEPSGTENDMLVQRIAAQAMQQQYSYNSAEDGTNQPAYGQVGGSSGPAAAAKIAPKYSKGGVDHNAAPVVRNENAEIRAAGDNSEAPPPGYVP